MDATLVIYNLVAVLAPATATLYGYTAFTRARTIGRNWWRDATVRLLCGIALVATGSGMRNLFWLPWHWWTVHGDHEKAAKWAEYGFLSDIAVVMVAAGYVAHLLTYYGTGHIRMDLKTTTGALLVVGIILVVVMTVQIIFLV